MQNSDHSSEEQQQEHAAAENTHQEGNQLAAGSVAPDKAEASTPAATPPQNTVDHSAIQQGLIYPPPPSFYQQAQAEPTRVSPVEQAQNSPQGHTIPGTQQTPQSYQTNQVPQAPGNAPGTPPPGYPRYTQGPGYPYPGSQPPPYYPGPVPAQASRQGRGWFRALWIVLGLVVLLSCGLCAWSSTAYFSVVSNQVAKSGTGQTVVNDFYDALQNKNYAQAYNDLHPQDNISGLTQDQFMQAAQKADEQHGNLLRYTQGPQQINSSSSGALTFTVDVSVVRQHASYTSHLTIGLVNNRWKILSYNQL